jgi:hypothetical protein
MQWTCSSCGTPNTGGIFCISCGKKIPPQQSELSQTVPPPVPTTQGRRNIPWISAGVTLTVALAFGAWQISLVQQAEVEVDTSKRLLSEAVSNQRTAETISENAEYEAIVCRYNYWCSVSTYSILLTEASSARDLVDLAKAKVTELNSRVATARADLAEQENIRNVGFGVGGVASVGAFGWALVSGRRSKTKDSVTIGS